MITPLVYDSEGRCTQCGAQPLGESLDGDARQVLLQIQHTAGRNAGLCPPTHEIAAIIGWPLERVEAAVMVLMGRDYLAPLTSSEVGDFQGQYRATERALHWRWIVEKLEQENAVLHKQLDGRFPIESELRAEIKRLHDMKNLVKAERAHKKGKLDALEAENQELRVALQEARALVEAQG